MYQHSVNLNHDLVTLDDFIILNSGYIHDKYQRKISEDLVIKSSRPNLRKKGVSFSLKRFNWGFNTFEVDPFFVFTFDIKFPRSNNMSGWVLTLFLTFKVLLWILLNLCKNILKNILH